MNLKRLLSCAILTLLLFANMSVIFYNSSLNADSSNGISIDIATIIYSQAEKRNEKADEDKKASLENSQSLSEPETPEQKIEREKKEKAEEDRKETRRKHNILNYNTKLRDLLHIVEFMSLSFLFVLLLLVLSMYRIYLNMIISAIFGITYAFSDEVHQIFVDGRSFEITDLLLDCTGVATGVLLGSAVFILCRRFLVNKN